MMYCLEEAPSNAPEAFVVTNATFVNNKGGALRLQPRQLVGFYSFFIQRTERP